MKCPICSQGELRKTKIKETQFEVDLGTYEGLQCLNCGETFFDEATTNKIIEKAKERGIFGIESRTKIARAGNSLAVRIPKKIVDLMDLKEGKEVRIHPSGKKIIIEQ